MPSLVIVLLTGAVLVALVRAGMNLGTDFVIKSQAGGRVSVTGRIPAGKVAAIREFFTRDLSAPGPITVRGSFGQGRALRLRFSRGVSPGQRQRVRNFLVELLR